jgi:hypothetical protein
MTPDSQTAGPLGRQGLRTSVSGPPVAVNDGPEPKPTRPAVADARPDVTARGAPKVTTAKIKAAAAPGPSSASSGAKRATVRVKAAEKAAHSSADGDAAAKTSAPALAGRRTTANVRPRKSPIDAGHAVKIVKKQSPRARSEPPMSGKVGRQPAQEAPQPVAPADKKRPSGRQRKKNAEHPPKPRLSGLVPKPEGRATRRKQPAAAPVRPPARRGRSPARPVTVPTPVGPVSESLTLELLDTQADTVKQPPESYVAGWEATVSALEEARNASKGTEYEQFWDLAAEVSQAIQRRVNGRSA